MTMSIEKWIQIGAAIISVPLLATIVLLVIWAVGYKITPRHLVITWLNVPIRWVRLDRITSVGTTPVFWSERWPNVLFAHGRFLVVHKTGWGFKNMVITPKNPFVFRAELYRTRDALLQGGATVGGGPTSASAAPQ